MANILLLLICDNWIVCFREELKKCQERFKQLEQERDQVFQFIGDAESDGNM